MRTIIAGSRTITDAACIREAILASGFNITIVISGGARGVDRLGEQWAREHGLRVEQYCAQWDIYGKSARMVRNKIMAQKADALIAVWDGRSQGTNNMIQLAYQHKLKVYVHNVGL